MDRGTARTSRSGMITAVDTSVLLAIDLGEPEAEAWVESLANAREKGGLVICDVVAAEFFAVVQRRAAFDATLDDLGIRPVPATLEAACAAGTAFRKYRDSGGPREHLIPDFLIAAHALTDCDALAAADLGYLRRYFRGLRVLGPAWKG